jgi:crotonobetainyl-CoA:carnitine CoA-transferase CaiB-like acyl-CoA transferase
MTPLAGLRILDLTSGPVGGLATMVLADFGALVERVIDPDFCYLNDVPSAKMWLRGKAICSELTDGINKADILIISTPHSINGVSYSEIKQLNPQIIYCEVSAFGEEINLPAYEAVVAAKAGRMQSMAGILKTGDPNYSAVPVATHATSQNIVSAVLAATYSRHKDGYGQKITTTMLQGLMPYDQGTSLSLQLRPNRRAPDPATIMPTLNYHPVQCADGKWLQLGNLLPHLFQSFMQVIGQESLLNRLPKETEQVRDFILQTMQTKTRDEWMALFVQDGGIAAHPYLPAEDTLQDPDMIMNGHVVTLNGVTQLGPIANLTSTPAVITSEAKETEGISWRAEKKTEAQDLLPLQGVTVLELATIIAAPLAASFLADMGARVIKVEAIGGDPYRHMAGGIGATRCNQGKESISIDLKSREGQKIVHQLATAADILIHNYRPGVPERLGIGYETLSKLNPQLIYVSANGYGPSGPGAMRPSTHPIPGAAMGGALHQSGYRTGGSFEELLSVDDLREVSRRLMRANEVNPDPNTSMIICSSSLLGLLARESSGRGQQIYVDMFGANAYANFDDMINYAGKPARAFLGESLKGPHPLHSLYETKSGWVFLGLAQEHEWQDFCQLSNSGLTKQYPTGITDNTSAFSEDLKHLFRTKTADEWENMFSGTGIGCVRADRYNLHEFFLSECNETSPWMTQVEHDLHGVYYRHAPMVSFSRGKAKPQAGAIAGVDGESLLQELGYTQDSISDLFDKKILWSMDLH